MNFKDLKELLLLMPEISSNIFNNLYYYNLHILDFTV